MAKVQVESDSDKAYIKPLLMTMYYDQSEHLYSNFPEAYLKFRSVVADWMIDVSAIIRMHMCDAARYVVLSHE